MQRLAVVAQRVLAQAELELRRVRKFGRRAEAAVLRIEASHQAGERLRRRRARQRFGGRAGFGAGFRLDARQRFDQPRTLFRDGIALLAIGGGDPRQEVHESRQAVAPVLRKIGAAIERLAVGREEHRQRPAPGAAREQRVRGLVDLVQIRTLLAVDLDVDEQLVHQRGHLRILERLVGHHMAPVACRVADRQQQRLAFPPRARLRLGAPRIPVDRVVRVLEQVGARLAGETIGHFCWSKAMRSKSAPRCRRRVSR